MEKEVPGYIRVNGMLYKLAEPRGPESKGLGPGGFCGCPKCGARIPHKTGVACTDETCPKCGAKMERPGKARRGTIEKTAQLQQLLQQFETLAGALTKGLADAHKAAMGKQFDRAASILQGITCDKIQELSEINNTMAGVAGIEGGK